jgi:uncharacterized protein
VPERIPAPKPNRPRNPDAPPKPARARDELGRPLPYGEPGRLEMEDFDSFPLERNHELGVEHFNAGRFFPAHEAWETAWKQAKGTPDAEFFKGLSQLGAGYVHLLRGNPHGAFTLMRRAAGRIDGYPSPHHGVHTDALAAAAIRDANEVESAEREGRPIPDVTPPRI